ncbi:MAG: Cysteine desulfurase, partial [uncultured Chloroflexia bacterium]
TLTAHKFYGPKGTGLLYVRHGIQIEPQINGGSQERRRRAGTENIPGIVGFAHALRAAEEGRSHYNEHCLALREQLIEGVIATIPHVHVNGHRTERLSNNANLRFEFIEGESLLMLLDQQGYCASAGSACTAGSVDPSHVLTALGIDGEEAIGSIRFSVGRSTTADDIAALLDRLPGMVERLRAMSPQYRELATA